MGGKSSRLVVNTKPTARCGTRLKGIVQLDITKPLKVENLHCRFVGRAKSAWNEGPLLKTGDHKVLSHSYHYSKFPAVLDPGVHEFPFAFNVPEGLPPSAHQSFGSVEYMVEAGLQSEGDRDRAWQGYEVTVFPSTSESTKLLSSRNRQRELWREQEASYLFRRGETAVKLNLESNVAAAGSSFSGNILLIDTSSLIHHEARVRLLAEVTYKSDDGYTRTMLEPVPGVETECLIDTDGGSADARGEAEREAAPLERGIHSPSEVQTQLDEYPSGIIGHGPFIYNVALRDGRVIPFRGASKLDVLIEAHSLNLPAVAATRAPLESGKHSGEAESGHPRGKFGTESEEESQLELVEHGDHEDLEWHRATTSKFKLYLPDMLVPSFSYNVISVSYLIEVECGKPGAMVPTVTVSAPIRIANTVAARDDEE